MVHPFKVFLHRFDTSNRVRNVLLQIQTFNLRPECARLCFLFLLNLELFRSLPIRILLPLIRPLHHLFTAILLIYTLQKLIRVGHVWLERALLDLLLFPLFFRLLHLFVPGHILVFVI